jgi:hypothetical protein
LELGIWSLEFEIANLEFGNLELGIWNLEFGIWNLGVLSYEHHGPRPHRGVSQL